MYQRDFKFEDHISVQETDESKSSCQEDTEEN